MMPERRLDPPDVEFTVEDVDVVHDAAALLDDAADKLRRLMPEQARELETTSAWLLRQVGPIHEVEFEDVI